MDKIKRIALTKDGDKFYQRENSKEIHTKFGYVRGEPLENAKPGDVLKTNIGEEFHIIDASFIDAYGKIKRGAQIIPLKDVGSIITETGLNPKSRVVDAGAGSGGLACMLALIASDVTTYDIRDDFLENVRANKEFLGLSNLNIKKGNIYEGVEETDVDIMTLDLPEPWLAVPTVEKSLKVGGFVMSYSPSIPQVMDFVAAIKKSGKFLHLKTIEITEREWDVEERKVRPKSQTIGHSGFMTFARKLHN